MPSDLIYREDAKDYARYAMAKGLNVIEYLDKVQAADFRPVVHGRWITPPKNRDYAHMIDYYECPLCGFIEDYLVNFCPNCGADMREANDEKT